MYQVDVLIQGFPGRAVCHGGLGWSTVTLLRAPGRTILVDVGAFGVRKELAKQLRARSVEPTAVTDVVLTHAHYDHSVNFTLFPNATVWIGAEELAWAARQPPGFNPLPELYVRELAASSRVRRIGYGDEFLPGLKALASPGHTPGHLLFYLTGNDVPLLFTGDAATTAPSCSRATSTRARISPPARQRSGRSGRSGGRGLARSSFPGTTSACASMSRGSRRTSASAMQRSRPGLPRISS